MSDLKSVVSLAYWNAKMKQVFSSVGWIGKIVGIAVISFLGYKGYKVVQRKRAEAKQAKALLDNTSYTRGV